MTEAEMDDSITQNAEKEIEDRKITVTIICRECNNHINIHNVSVKGYLNWLDGMLIQKALPDIDYKLRELFISRTCPKCWDKMFKFDK